MLVFQYNDINTNKKNKQGGGNLTQELFYVIFKPLEGEVRWKKTRDY